jgi:two-component system, OmpR family, phosphate regulon response regulator PhoB
MADTLVVLAGSNPDLLEQVSTQLSKRGYEVASAADGQQALETIRARRPAAAVLDWVMPVLQGPKVCALLKADPATADIPVVLLTARATEQDIAAGFEEGVDDYLTKPFAVEELDEVLRRLIGKKKA